MRWFNQKLSGGAYRLGGFIALYPKSILLFFVTLSFCILSIGIPHYVYENDVEYLYTVTNGQSKEDRAVVENYFPFNDSARFDISRVTRLGPFVRILVMGKNEGNLLKADLWKEIQDLDTEVRNLTIDWGNSEYKYSDLCVKWFEDCYSNEVLEIGDVMSEFEMGKTRISYPIFFNLKTYKTSVLAPYIGGVNVSDDGFSLKAVKAVMLNYFITEANDNEMIKHWEKSVLDLANKIGQSSKNLKFYFFAKHTLTEEVDENIKSCIIPLIVALFIVLLYTIFSTTSSSDWVKSKPLVAIMGGVSGILGLLASIGILCYLQVPLIAFSTMIPFIMLAIGIDDTFVMLSVWRTTSPHDSVPKRMAECYSEAVVSVTITTLTDMFSFYVGVFTPIPSIRIFSLYAGTGVFCIFIWQIFFFGAALAIGGYYEAQNRHSVFWCIKATPMSKSENLSALKRFVSVGGVDPLDPHNPQNRYIDTTSIFFRDTLAPFLCKKWVKISVLLTFLLYLTISTFGVLHLQEGLELSRMARYNSYMVDYYGVYDEYFTAYPYRLQVIISQPLDYSLESNQRRIKDVLNRLTEDPVISNEFNENWLNSFTTYVENYKEFVDFNVSTEAAFIKTLREEYLKENSQLSQDVVFNKDFTKIIASRFILQMKNGFTMEIVTTSVGRCRDVLEEFKYEGLNITIYNPWFHFVDQFLIVKELTFKLIGLAIIIVMVITALLIPSFICCVCVLFSIFSIVYGVFGFMALLGINLDIVSLSTIVVSVGFSVDFAAHVSYAYICSTADTSEGKIKDCLFSLGKPVLQGAVSTLLALSTLHTIESYIFQAGCKIISLIILFAMAHALVFLPVLLSIQKPPSFMPLPWKRSKTYFLNHEKPQKCVEISNGTQIKSSYTMTENRCGSVP